MMKKGITVSSRQMATLFLLFLTGSAIVNIPAPLLGQRKVLLGCLFGWRTDSG